MTEKRRNPALGVQHRTTINLGQREKDDLDFLVDALGESQTEVVKQAIRWYRKLREIEINGGDISVREAGDNAPMRLWFV